MTSTGAARIVATMRTTLALALLLAACGSTSNAPPPSADAAGDAPTADAGDGAACDFTRERLIPGRGCVSATPDNCDGMRCAAPLVCATQTGPDGGREFVCVPD